MTDSLKVNLTSTQTWLRLLFMLLFACTLQLAAFVMWAAVVLQFVLTLVNGEPNPKLRELTQGLCSYIFQCLNFVGFISDEKPFPFSDWPQADSSVATSAAAEMDPVVAQATAPQAPVVDAAIIESTTDDASAASPVVDGASANPEGEAGADDDTPAKTPPSAEKP